MTLCGACRTGPTRSGILLWLRHGIPPDWRTLGVCEYLTDIIKRQWGGGALFQCKSHRWVKLIKSRSKAGLLTAKDLIGVSVFVETAHTEVDEANSRQRHAGVNKEIFHLNVPVENVYLLEVSGCIHQLLHCNLKDKKRELRDQRRGCLDMFSWLSLWADYSILAWLPFPSRCLLWF